jgi:hypothetical protein
VAKETLRRRLFILEIGLSTNYATTIAELDSSHSIIILLALESARVEYLQKCERSAAPLACAAAEPDGKDGSCGKRYMITALKFASLAGVFK